MAGIGPVHGELRALPPLLLFSSRFCLCVYSPGCALCASQGLGLPDVGILADEAGLGIEQCGGHVATQRD